MTSGAYRNTKQVLLAAQGIVSADSFDDLEDLAESGDRDIKAVRDGVPVSSVVASDLLSLDVALIEQLRRGSLADTGVLCRTSRDVARIMQLLARHEIPVVDLVDYDGTASAAVKVGTVKRAKGLEFGRVIIPRVDSYLVRDGTAEPERIQRERRELFVGMTRARDELWLGCIEAGSG